MTSESDAMRIISKHLGFSSPDETRAEIHLTLNMLRVLLERSKMTSFIQHTDEKYTITLGDHNRNPLANLNIYVYTNGLSRTLEFDKSMTPEWNAKYMEGQLSNAGIAYFGVNTPDEHARFTVLPLGETSLEASHLLVFKWTHLEESAPTSIGNWKLKRRTSEDNDALNTAQFGLPTEVDW